VRANQVKLGTNAFFLPEGDERYYRGPRYGEARIDHDGQPLLTGLRDQNLQKLGPHNLIKRTPSADPPAAKALGRLSLGQLSMSRTTA
jgi:GDYXXLXY motif protein